jgi:hypothetical protein
MGMRGLTFSGGFILGAGLMYLLDPERSGLGDPQASSPEPRGRWRPGLECLAGALGLAALAYGANWIARRADEQDSTATALDVDMPNYAWLR